MPRKSLPHPCACSIYSAIDNNERTIDTACRATTKRTFAPGHDAKLKGFLIKCGLAHLEVNDGNANHTPEAIASRYGFGHMVKSGISEGKLGRAEASDKRRKRQAAAERRNDEALEHDGNAARRAREARSLAEQVEEEEAKFAAEQPARPEPEWDDDPTEQPVVKAKVGRWIYEGTVNGDGDTFEFTYVNGKGETVSTTKFTLV